MESFMFSRIDQTEFNSKSVFHTRLSLPVLLFELSFCFLEPGVNPLGEFALWRHLALLLLPSLLPSLSSLKLRGDFELNPFSNSWTEGTTIDNFSGTLSIQWSVTLGCTTDKYLFQRSWSNRQEKRSQLSKNFFRRTPCFLLAHKEEQYVHQVTR